MNRRESILALVALGAMPWTAQAQQPQAKVARLGYLASETSTSQRMVLEALLEGLRGFGYVEGRTLAIEYRWADGHYERLPGLAAELVRLKVDVIVAEGVKAAQAAKGATQTIPIVLPATADPVGAGLVENLGRPGGNLTGSATFGPEITAKRLEFLRQAMPRVNKVAVLLNPANPNSRYTLQLLRDTAGSMKLTIEPFDVRERTDFEGTFAAMAKARIGALVVAGDTLFTTNSELIARLATEKKLAVAGRVELAEAGGLIGYGSHSADLYRKAASLVDRILKGAKPGDLPIERATEFELVINRKTAKALGVSIPQALLVRADRLID